VQQLATLVSRRMLNHVITLFSSLCVIQSLRFRCFAASVSVLFPYSFIRFTETEISSDVLVRLLQESEILDEILTDNKLEFSSAAHKLSPDVSNGKFHIPQSQRMK
jgi:hypothetical protein